MEWERLRKSERLWERLKIVEDAIGFRGREEKRKKSKDEGKEREGKEEKRG